MFEAFFIAFLKWSILVQMWSIPWYSCISMEWQVVKESDLQEKIDLCAGTSEVIYQYKNFNPKDLKK